VRTLTLKDHPSMTKKNSAFTDDILRTLPHAVGPEKSVLSSVLQEPERFIRRCLEENIVADDFYLPAHQEIYRTILHLNEQGVEIELVSFVQKLLDAGKLDKVGGPAAVTDVYGYAPASSHFDAHVQILKDKAILRTIIRNANRQIAAAYDSPDEVTELVETSTRDLQKVVAKAENKGSNLKKYHSNLVCIEEMEQETRDYFSGNVILDGDPCFLPDYKLGFRKHEFTVWLGVSNHGKSQAVQNQVAYLAANGRRSMIASLEQKPSVTLSQILKCMTAYPDLHKSDEWSAAYRYITSMVRMYKGTDRTCPKHLVEIWRQAYLNDGIDTFLADNLMCFNVDRGDNSALASAMDTLRTFFNDYPVHGHLVVHPRKTSDENVGKPATQNSIRGPAEIGDMPQSVVVVHRDMEKTDRIEEMKAELLTGNITQAEIDAFWASTPCGKIITRKQRATGEMPQCKVWFDPTINQFMRDPRQPTPMFKGAPPWHAAST
jgi:hypothetical protein